MVCKGDGMPIADDVMRGSGVDALMLLRLLGAAVQGTPGNPQATRAVAPAGMTQSTSTTANGAAPPATAKRRTPVTTERATQPNSVPAPPPGYTLDAPPVFTITPPQRSQQDQPVFEITPPPPGYTLDAPHGTSEEVQSTPTPPPGYTLDQAGGAPQHSKPKQSAPTLSQMQAADAPPGIRAAVEGPGTFFGTREPGDTWSDLFHHPIKFAESIPSELHDLATKPAVNLEALQPVSTEKEHPFYASVAKAASGFLTPENIGIGALVGPIYKAAAKGDVMAQVVSRAASATFAALMAKGHVEQANEFAKAYEAGDVNRMLEIAGEFAVTAPFTLAAGFHAARGSPTAAPAERTNESATAGQQAAPEEPQRTAGALPAGKEPKALPPKPGVQTEELRSQRGPGKKAIGLPAQTPTRIPSSVKPIAVGESAVVDPRELTRANGSRPNAASTATAARPAPVSAGDLKLELKKLDNREREIDQAMMRSRAGTDANAKRIQQLRQISSQRAGLNAQLEKLEPRPVAKPLSKAPDEDEPISVRSIGGQSLTHQQMPAAKPEPTPTEKLLAKAKTEAKEKPKTPTYDALPPEMREVADVLAKNHKHLPQSLREADEAEHRKLSLPGTPLKEQIARRMARNEKLPYADRVTGEMLQPKPEARPLSERRTPIGERRLENEGAPKGIERRMADRRAQREADSRQVMRQAIVAEQRKTLRDPEATAAERQHAQDLIDQIRENPTGGDLENELGFSDLGRAREDLAQKPKPEAAVSGAKIGDTIRFRDRQGNELEGRISDRSAQTQMWRVETKGGSVAVPDDRIVSANSPAPAPGMTREAALPGMETAVREQKAAAEAHRGEELTKELARPLGSIDERAGEMERNSPLFRDTEASPQRGLFSTKKEPRISLGEAMPANREAERATGTQRHNILVDGKKAGEVHVSPKHETLHVTWMGEPLTREGGKPEELNALSNKIGAAGVRQVVRELHRLYPEAEELSYTREGGAAGRLAHEHGEVAARTMLLGKGSRLHAGVDPTMVRDLFDRMNRLYDQHIAGPAIEKMGLGRSHKDVEAIDPKLASRIRRYEAAPQYFRTRAEDIANAITKGLTRKQERLFVLMADEQSRENLRENHPAEFAEALRDKAVQSALERYKPHADDLTKARTILGGSVMPGDHLPWMYPKHVSGIGQRVAETDLRSGGFDRGITPQRVDQFGRKTTAEYHYANGLHEFGPAFVRKYSQTMTKIAEHATALDFLSEATKIESGDRQPPMIAYNGKRFYNPEILRMIREAAPGKASAALAESLGVKTLPKPKDAEAYAEYRPTTAKDAPAYLGPRAVVQAMKGLAEETPGKMGPVGRFLQEQIIGMGLGVRHGFNLFRRITQQFPLGVSSPVNWVRAARVMTDGELRARALSRTNDPAYDSLLRWGGISPEGASAFKEYQGRNLNPANWLRAFAEIGNRWLFRPGGVDQRARLWMHDLVKSQRPDLSAEKISQLVREALGNYSRQNWTSTQRLLSRFLLFPGWDFSSIAWVLRHPIRTAVPPAILIMLANQAIHRAGGKQESGDQFDPFAIHVGGHSYGTPGFEEPLARAALKPIGRAAQALLEGETGRQAVGEGVRAVPQALAGIAGMTRPDFRLPFEIAANKTLFGKDIVAPGDYTRRGAAGFNQGAEDIGEHVLKSFFPLVERTTDQNQNAADALISNFGVSRYQENPRRAPFSERRQDMLNVKDDLRRLRERARAITTDRALSEDEKEERLAALREQARRMIARDRPQPH